MTGMQRCIFTLMLFMSTATEVSKFMTVVLLIFVMATLQAPPSTLRSLVLSFNPAVFYTTWLSSAIRVFLVWVFSDRRMKCGKAVH